MAPTDDARELSKREGHNVHHDEASGRLSENYTDEEFLQGLRDLGGMGSSTEVHETVGTGARETAYKRLRRLEEEGRITSRSIGGSKLWILPGELSETAEEIPSAD